MTIPGESTSRPAPGEKSAETAAERAWQSACGILMAKLGKAAFDLGIKPLRFSGVDGDVARLVAPGATVTWIKNHHPGVLEDAMRAAGWGGRIQVVGHGRSQGELFPGGPPAASRRPARFGSLVPRYTFATFVVGGGNQFAHAACKAVASQPGSHYNPLFLYGGVGLGKTHLANAIGHETIERQPQARVAYLSAESFMTQLITAIRSKRMEEFKGTFRKVDVLIVDDVQFLANREGTQEEFFHTFNALHEAHRQIVLTSDKVPKDIPALEERLRNRFEWGLIADIQPPDMETRVAILEKKAEIEGIDLSREVAIYLASEIHANVRELEGSLNRLSAVASLQKTSITVDFAREVMQDLFRNRRTVTIEAVQAAVCQHYGIRIGDMLSKKRTKNVAFPRQVAMYLTRKLTRASFPSIGERFGGRDHSTVIHAAASVGRKITEDEGLREIVEQIERAAQNLP